MSERANEFGMSGYLNRADMDADTGDAQAGAWISHDGKGMPVAPETHVHIKARNGYSEEGFTSAETAAFWEEESEEDGGWIWKDGPGDIIAYRVVPA